MKIKISGGFPVNNNTAYSVLSAEDESVFFTKDKDIFDKAIKDGFITISEESKAEQM